MNAWYYMIDQLTKSSIIQIRNDFKFIFIIIFQNQCCYHSLAHLIGTLTLYHGKHWFIEKPFGIYMDDFFIKDLKNVWNTPLKIFELILKILDVGILFWNLFRRDGTRLLGCLGIRELKLFHAKKSLFHDGMYIFMNLPMEKPFCLFNLVLFNIVFKLLDSDWLMNIQRI